jgi:hypothetical protein
MNLFKKKKPIPASNMPPIVVTNPSIIPEKMQAIQSLCRTVEILAKALDSANISARVENCVVYNDGGGVGISIGPGTKNSSITDCAIRAS